MTVGDDPCKPREKRRSRLRSLNDVTMDTGFLFEYTHSHTSCRVSEVCWDESVVVRAVCK